MFDVDRGKWTEHDESYDDIEDYYAEELDAFIQAAKGGEPYPYTFGEDLKLLRWLVEAEENGAKI